MLIFASMYPHNITTINYHLWDPICVKTEINTGSLIPYYKTMCTLLTFFSPIVM